MGYFIIFTLFCICMLFWGGAILAFVGLLLRAAFWITLAVLKIALIMLGCIPWCIWWLVNRQAAMKAYRAAVGDRKTQ